MRQIILASKSPRRRELMTQIGLPYTVIPAKGEEQPKKTLPAEVVEELAYTKALEVWDKQGKKDDCIVIGADTLVAYGNQILGKPVDKQHNLAMIMQLQGNVHQVYTGVAMIWEEFGERKLRVFHQEVQVECYTMTTQEAMEYVDSLQGADKAGGYGIQNKFARYVKSIQGDYNTVVGLPVGRLYQELKMAGLV